MNNNNKKYYVKKETQPNMFQPTPNETQKMTTLMNDYNNVTKQQPKEQINDIVTIYCLKSMVLDKSKNGILIWFKHESNEIIKLWISNKFVFTDDMMNYIRIGIKQSFTYGLFNYKNTKMKDNYDYQVTGDRLISSLIRSGKYFTNKYEVWNYKIEKNL